jgi:hypothetical protein
MPRTLPPIPKAFPDIAPWCIVMRKSDVVHAGSFTPAKMELFPGSSLVAISSAERLDLPVLEHVGKKELVRIFFTD